MAEAMRGGNWTKDFFPDDMKFYGRMDEFALESLPGRHVFTLLWEYKGKIIKTDREEVVLSNGERIKRTAWPLYAVLDRPPEDAMEAHA